jgi:cellulose synthase/poly-beta-1,6-N-acetylglucosamine synthase-like glycosyltransferase
LALSKSFEATSAPAASSAHPAEAIRQLRDRGAAGGLIPEHRAFATLSVGWVNGGLAVALAVGATLLWLGVLPGVGRAWAAFFQFWQQALHLSVPVLSKEYQLLPGLSVHVPYLGLAAAPPSRLVWWLTAGATLALFGASYLVPRRRLPMIYGLRWLSGIQAAALLCFWIAPARFPHPLPDYMADMLASSLALITLMPALLGLTFYLFNVGVTRKLLLTATLMGYLCVVVPFQYLGQAYLLHHCSLLFMPVCYLVFGLPLDVLFITAFYGWGMSWPERRQAESGSWWRWMPTRMNLSGRLRPGWQVAVLLLATATLALTVVMLRARPLHATNGYGAPAWSQIRLSPVGWKGDATPAFAQSAAPSPRSCPWSWPLQNALLGIAALIGIYTFRHYCFTLSRLFGEQRHPYVDVDTADWPAVTVFIAAHNEEAVVAHCLEALLQVDYPPDRLQIMPVNDRSTDRTREIIDDHVKRYPGRIMPFHRTEGKPGKAAALKDATDRVDSEIVLIFDADYIPSRGLIKQLVAPFFDPEIGAVMGRVVPLNAGTNLLTRLLDLERSGGYQVDQQARMNLRLVPQYGGTVGGVRRSALDGVGGWLDDTLAEDTDLTYRLLLRGWKIAYQNRSECYEEVPETWPVRARQISRWAKGHNQAMARYSLPLLFNPLLSLRERLDGSLLLGIYVTAVLLLVGWTLSLVLFCVEAQPMPGVVPLLAVTSYSSLGNLAAFFEIAAAARLDGYRGRIRLLPLNALGFLVSLVCVSGATLSALTPGKRKQRLVWHKTERFRAEMKS